MIIHQAVKGTIFLAVFSVVSRLFGLLRERILAATFGAGNITDAYFAAFKIPDFIFTTLVLGALSAAFVPIFIQVRERDGLARAWRLTGSVITWLTIALSVVACIAYLGAPTLVRIIAPGFSAATLSLTVTLTRVMLLSVLFFGASNVMSGVLNASHRYGALSVAPVFYNLGIITGILLFVPRMGPIGLGWGVVLGACLHFFVQLPSVLRLSGYSLLPTFSFLPETRRIMKLMGPRMLGLAASQFNLVIITILASSLASGSVAVYNFAYNLVSFPSSVIGVSIAVAVFPFFATHAARNDTRAVQERVRVSVLHILSLLIPLTFFLIALRAQVVRIVLGAGAFDWNDTVMTAHTVGFLALSLCADGCIPLLARTFYAFQDTITPVRWSIAAVCINLVLAFYLRQYGVEGIAFAFAITQFFLCVSLAYSLQRKVHAIFTHTFFLSIGKMVFAAVVGTIFLQLLKVPLADVVDMETGVGVLIQAACASGTGFFVYYFLARFLGAPIPGLYHMKSVFRKQ